MVAGDGGAVVLELDGGHVAPVFDRLNKLARLSRSPGVVKSSEPSVDTVS